MFCFSTHNKNDNNDKNKIKMVEVVEWPDSFTFVAIPRKKLDEIVANWRNLGTLMMGLRIRKKKKEARERMIENRLVEDWHYKQAMATWGSLLRWYRGVWGGGAWRPHRRRGRRKGPCFMFSRSHGTEIWGQRS